MRRVFICVLGLLLLLASCKAEGGLSLNVKIKSSTSKTIAPDSRLMSTSRYSLSGKGPKDMSFGPLFFEDANIRIDGLTDGQWTLEACALNPMDVSLAKGQATINLTKNSQDIEISLEEIPGTGNLDVLITWNRDGMIHPEDIKVEAVVTDAQDRTYTPQLSINKVKGQARVLQTLEAGSYLLTVTLKEGSTNKGGAVEAVRIVQSNTSQARLEFTFSETGFVINDHTSLPLEGVLEYESIDENLQRLTYTVSRSSDVHYLWFCQGQKLDVEDSPCIVIPRTLGTLRYNVVAYTTALGSWGSASIIVTN